MDWQMHSGDMDEREWRDLNYVQICTMVFSIRSECRKLCMERRRNVVTWASTAFPWAPSWAGVRREILTDLTSDRANGNRCFHSMQFVSLA